MSNIAFCGDSFCEISSDEPFGAWTNLLRDHYDAHILCGGLGGRALIHSYEKLLPVIDDADYVIFCITDPNRLPNRDAQALTINTEIRSANTLKEAAFHYYKHIFHENYHSMAQIGILMQMDQLMIQKQKKCIWFPCFVNSMQGYMPQSGPISNIHLGDISYKEFDTRWMHLKRSKEEQESDPPMFTHAWAKMLVHKDIIKKDLYITKCHMNEKNNICLANVVIDIIDSDDFSPRTITMEDYFNGN